jgi:signal transduction histidine kinase
MRWSFKNRMAFYYMVATAVVAGTAFAVIFWMARTAMYARIDADLAFEAQKHTAEFAFDGDSLQLLHAEEWREREHREVEVSPVFLQLVDGQGKVLASSPNLKGGRLPFRPGQLEPFDALLQGRAVRLLQLPLRRAAGHPAYIVVAMPTEAALGVLKSLRQVLWMLYPVMLLALFLTSRYLAGQHIAPIRLLTHATRRIGNQHLHERVPLPEHRDELHVLASAINDLFARIEEALLRERQFTADASHELRTPLAALKGTLEVLVRKPRTPQEYEDKIRRSMQEIGRLEAVLEQLLRLARMGQPIASDTRRPLGELLQESLERHHDALLSKGMDVRQESAFPPEATAPAYYAQLILDNLIGNAAKHAPAHTALLLAARPAPGGWALACTNQAGGAGAEDPSRLFEPFFRGEQAARQAVPGSGLGLSIAKKAAEAIQGRLEVGGRQGEIVFTAFFPLHSD